MWKTQISPRAATLFYAQTRCVYLITYPQVSVGKFFLRNFHRLFVNCTQENVKNCGENLRAVKRKKQPLPTMEAAALCENVMAYLFRREMIFS